MAVIAASAGLRLHGITTSPIYRSDEGFYLMEARRLVGQVEACRKILEIYRRDRPSGLIHLSPQDEAQVLDLARQGYGQIGARLLHDVFIAIGLAVSHGADWIGNAISGLFGTATVVLIGSWACWLWGPSAGIYAAAFLGASTIHLAFSRSTLCEADATFLSMLFLYLYARRGTREGAGTCTMVALGFVFGLSFLANLRAVPVLYCTLLVDLLVARWRDLPARWLALGVGIVLPLCLAEAFFYGLLLVSSATGVLLTRQTFLLSFLWQIRRLHGGVLQPGGNLGFHLRALWTLETTALLALVPAGYATLLLGMPRLGSPAGSRPGAEGGLTRVPRGALWISAVAPLFLLGYWELAVGLKFLRYIVVVLPLLALWAGRGLQLVDALACSLLARGRRTDVWIMPALALAVFAWGGVRAWGLRPAGPGFREVEQALAREGPPRIVATQPNIFRFWLGEKDVAIAATPAELRRQFASGYRWYVSCFQKYHADDLPSLQAIDRMLETSGPALEFQNPAGNLPITWLDNAVSEVPPAWAQDAARIRVWDLSKVLAPSVTPTPTPGPPPAPSAPPRVVPPRFAPPPVASPRPLPSAVPAVTRTVTPSAH